MQTPLTRFRNPLGLSDSSSGDSHGQPPRMFPTRVDQYRLVRSLGWGGSGIVCEAEDTCLGWRVAIKLIPHDLRPGPAMLRLPREASFADVVRHPHVVSLDGAGKYADGSYLVMELMAGQSVQSRLNDGPLRWREATEILAAACAGAGAVHARGIVHCDIKPGNLLCAADGTVKLADFGLACWLDPAKRPSDDRRSGGTPAFMSPEQCRDEDLDERTDIYSLGATYYTLLTGRTPFTHAGVMGMMFEHCFAPAPDPRQSCRDIPSECAAIVTRAMAKKRADRFGSAKEMGSALRRALPGRFKAWRI